MFNTAFLRLLLILLVTTHSHIAAVRVPFLKQVALPVRPTLVEETLAKGEPLYYFAIGSNLSRKKLENRGINGTKIDILSMEAGYVTNYRLAFNLRGFPPIEPGMGALEPIDGSSSPLLQYAGNECHGALIKLTPENYEKVMKSEGINGARTQGYDEIMVDVYPYKYPSKPVKAISLRAREHVRLRKDPCPSARYMTILKDGAKELGLKPCYQTFLAEHPTQKMPQWLKKIAFYNLVFTGTLSFRFKFRLVSRIQSFLLYQFYDPNSHWTTDALTTAVLLPGSFFGLVYYQVLAKTGNLSPFIQRFQTLLEIEPKEVKSSAP
jgi:hypothetical protein